MKDVKTIICDSTLRDGSHACAHQLTVEQIRDYATAADQAGVDYVEVGHGNGLGASSLQVGESRLSDAEMLSTAASCLRQARLSVHVMPGIATVDRDLRPAIDAGVALFRIGAHCTEADLTQRHITYVRNTGRLAWGVLMMTHMATPELLVEEGLKLQNYGAQGLVLMDSAGALLPDQVSARITRLVDRLDLPIGFHGHQNLGLAVANSIAALDAGARILDATARGFGAGAGNTPLELLAAVLHQSNRLNSLNLYRALDAGEVAGRLFAGQLPVSDAITIVSGLSGVFSGFVKPVLRISRELAVDPRDVFIELGRRAVVGGQEDLILEVAHQLAARKTTSS